MHKALGNFDPDELRVAGVIPERSPAAARSSL